jgi:tripartite-type tricarboxylate transporter receptor subunit TctC
MKRRGLLLAPLLPGALPTASAQPVAPFPSRPITITVGFPPGGLSDAMTRALGQRIGQELGQAVVVDNRPGAGTSYRPA